MKQLLLALITICVAFAARAEPSLFHANSKTLGYAAIDLDVTEISRDERTSLLRIKGFHGRTAYGSRWLMCAYTALAQQRTFTSWAAYYPDPPDEDLLLIFPESESDNLEKLAGRKLDNARLLPPAPVKNMLVLCGRVLQK